ncbi:DUF2326 domain-containing protein [Moritella sp. 28]|uniref:DUF2326 domain-containing protein n=1 Tax=Moritella sp. 28 TaxID=2746232 RepID=UPI001BA90ED2|nr:DUF2326 domain-containing protein [Moritella sp. 28]QUM85466.1 DUF2326 domain-containing protein [Moritella sp. 28]
MLKLSKIYSNKEDLFPTIEFRDGLNVIFANVTKNDDSKSSHSLGKTTLVELINYMLLKSIDKHSFLKKEEFKGFIFYLEIEYRDDCFVTIKRVVNGKVSLTSLSKKDNLSSFDNEKWDETDLGLDKAKKYFDSIVSLDIVTREGFSYRNGLRYCLRKQTQYEDTFKVNTSREPDSSWKSYLAGVIGINSEIVKNKYETNKKIELLKSAIKQIQLLPQESAQSLDAEIAQIEAAVSRMQLELDQFDFRRSDIDINEELVQVVSKKVSDLNSEIYKVDQQLFAIKESLNTEFSFDLNKVKELFSEVEIYFPDNLSNSYEDLIELNQQMSTGRKYRLKQSQGKLYKERGLIEVALTKSLQKQKELASILLQKDAFKKYKILQAKLSKEESRLAVLQDRVEKLDAASNLSENLDKAIAEQSEAGKILQKATRVRDNNKMKNSVEIFSEIVDYVLGISAFFYTDTNRDGNLEFNIGLKDQTSVNDGFSYTRTLSAIFDFTLLLIHSNESFYRFCYHDGLLESLDDRVKIKLIDKMRSLSEEFGMQFIISVLDSDIPNTPAGEKVYFKTKEIIRELHDKGSSGRLFRMSAF